MALGPVMLDLVGTEITPEEHELLLHPQTGGVILFTRNFESVAQLTELVRAIHALRDPHLLVAVDHEGGRVQRFREGFTRLPPVSRLGEIYRQDRQRARELATESGWLMAAELRAVGIDFSFAPVLDVAHGLSGVIGDRAFHSDPEILADLAHHYMQGMNEAGMAATGKHFPGHGGVKEDSHLALPVDRRPLEDIRQADLVPFERMIHYGLAAIMPAHVIYTQADPELAGFSAFWLQGVLRHELGFQGVIFSDDLSMAAAHVAGSFAQRARKALDAGCDMVLVCNHPDGAREVLDSLEGYDNPVSQVRLARMHGRRPQAWAELHASARWIQAAGAVAAYDESPYLELDV
ncbi:MAG TPA: beta-N-acetylhexosaminidase [Thioalkalivibrio sp.]|nr:beta-N-acetylhexosaminidase [Thioalkalivibrio sp.]